MLRFDGSTGYVTAPSPAPLRGDNSRSVELWFSTTSTTQQQLLDAGSAGTNAGAFLLGLTGAGGVGANPSVNTPGLYLALWNADFYLPGLTLTDGKPHHVVVTLTGSVVTLYVDGATPAGLVYRSSGWSGLVSQPFTSPLTPNTTANTLLIGHARYGIWGTGSTYFNGTLDDVAVYNHALPAAAVQAHRSAGAQYQAAVIADDPYAYYRLHETAPGTIADAVPSSNPATAAGGFTSTPSLVDGDSGTALRFDGRTSYVSTPLVDPVWPGLTVETWFSLSELPADNVRLVASSHSDIDHKGFELVINKGGASGFADVGTGAAHIMAVWNQQLAVGTVYHYVLTYDGTRVKAYLNGTLVASNTGASGPVAPSGLPIMLGRDPAYDGRDYVAGTLDEVALYDTALPTSRIQAHAGAGAGYQAAVTADNPAAYYRLDDGIGPSEVEFNQARDTIAYHGVGQTAGALAGTADPAGSFNGGTSYAALPGDLLRRHTYLAIELWFRTTAADQPLWSSTANPLGADLYDGNCANNLYVDSAGRLRGLLSVAGATPIQSSQPVNDGGWHHVVLSGAGSVQSLYLDGALVGSVTGQIDNRDLAHEYLGAGIGLGPGISHFSGAIDDVALYDHPLGQPAVQAHYAARLGAGELTGITLPSGKTRATLAYDVGHDRVSQLTDALGGVWQPSLPTVTGSGSQLARVVTVTDPLGNRRTYRYDVLHGGRMLSYSLGTGQVQTFGYDTGGFASSFTDENGHGVSFANDARGNMLSRTACQSAGTCFTSYYGYYLNAGDPTDPRNDQVTSTADGRSAGPTDATYRTTYTYAANGNLASATTPATPDFPNGQAIRRGYTTGSEPAVGGGSTPAGLLASVTDARGGVIRYAYASNGDLRQVTDPVGLVTRYGYDAIGRLGTSTEVSDSFAGGLVTSYGYDGASRQTSVTEPSATNAVTGASHGRRTSYGYDPDGNVTSRLVTDTDTDTGDARQVRTTAYSYDEHNLLASVVAPDGAESDYAYDAMGNRVRYIDAGRHEFDYAVNSRGQVLSRTLHASNDPNLPPGSDDLVLDSYAYDPAGRLASHTDAMGRTTAYTYYDDGLAATTVSKGFHNPDGSTRDIVLSANSYDPAGNRTRLVTGGGLVRTDSGYDAAGRLTSTVLDPAGLHRETDYTYDAADDPILLTRSAAGSGEAENTDYGYDAMGRLTSACVRNGGTSLCTTVTRDQRGKAISVEDPRGSVPGATAFDFTTEYGYDAAGRLTAVTGPPRIVENDGVPAETGNRPVTRTGYDAFGDATESQDPLGNLTRVAFDAVGRPTRATMPTYTPPGGSPVTPTVAFGYDPLGNLTAVTDALGRSITFRYDALGRRASQVDPQVTGQAGPGTWTYGYDAAGELLSSTDPTGARTEATYDDLGRQITATIVERHPAGSTSPQNLTTTLGYDDAGNRTSTVRPSGWTSGYSYDAASEQVTATPRSQHPEEKTSYTYDLAGRLATVTNSMHEATAHGYDPAGRLTSISNLTAWGAVARTRSFGYDPAGNRTSSTDGNGLTTSYTYDAANQLTTLVEPVDGTSTITTTFGYDAAGDRTRVTDGRGNSTVYTYNPLGLRESVIEPSTPAFPSLADRTYTSSYDANGQLLRLVEPGGVTRTSSYDELGRLVKETGSGAEAPTSDRVLDYDLAGRQTSVSAPGGTDTYTYDDRGDLLSAAGPSGSGAFSYDLDANMASRSDAAGSRSFTFTEGRLTATTGGGGLDARTYSYDAAGRLSMVNDQLAGGGWETDGYDHDALGRLSLQSVVTSGGATSSISYGYDKEDHLTSKAVTGMATADGSNTYHYDGLGRLTSWTAGSTTTSYAYDAAGNRTQAGGTAATFDARNRLLSDGATTFTHTARGTLASRTSGGSTRTATFDALDRLVTDGAAAYSYDGLDRPVTTRGGSLGYADRSGNVISDSSAGYGRDPAGALLTVNTTTTAGTQQVTSVGRAWTDRHGDLVGVFDAGTGSRTGAAGYDPFGRPLTSSGVNPDLGYQGAWTDPATGQVSMGARWYDPGEGRFDSRDSWDLPPLRLRRRRPARPRRPERAPVRR